MRVQVVNVMFLWSRMHHSHLHGIIDVTVMHVGRIIGIQDLSGLPAEDQIAIGIGRIRRLVNYLRRIANGPG